MPSNTIPLTLHLPLLSLSVLIDRHNNTCESLHRSELYACMTTHLRRRFVPHDTHPWVNQSALSLFCKSVGHILAAGFLPSSDTKSCARPRLLLVYTLFYIQLRSQLLFLLLRCPAAITQTYPTSSPWSNQKRGGESGMRWSVCFCNSIGDVREQLPSFQASCRRRTPEPSIFYYSLLNRIAASEIRSINSINIITQNQKFIVILPSVFLHGEDFLGDSLIRYGTCSFTLRMQNTDHDFTWTATAATK
jgi:hypothetical protein